MLFTPTEPGDFALQLRNAVAFLGAAQRIRVVPH
jgi:hypothetical protein